MTRLRSSAALLSISLFAGCPAQNDDGCRVVDGPGAGEHTVTCGDSSVVLRDGDAAEGEGDAAEGEGEGDTVGEGEGEGDTVGEGEGDAIGEGEGEGEGEACVVAVGNVFVESSLDVEALQRVCRVEGNLQVSRDGLVDFDLPALQVVTGDLGVFASTVTHIDLEQLSDVGGALTLDTGAEATVLPALRSAGFFLAGTTAANASVELPRLAAVGGLAIRDHASLSAPLLRTVGEGGAGSGSLNVLANSAVVVDLPALESVRETVSVHDNPNLVALTLPALVSAGSVNIDANPALQSIDMRLLDSVSGTVTINGPSLVDCSGVAIVDAGDCIP